MSQKSAWAVAQQQFDLAAKRLNLDPGIAAVLREPRRQLTVHFPVRMDDGSTRVFEGHRVGGHVHLRLVFSKLDLARFTAQRCPKLISTRVAWAVETRRGFGGTTRARKRQGLHEGHSTTSPSRVADIDTAISSAKWHAT